MSEEDKIDLYKELCARLPYYGLKVRYNNQDFEIIDIGFGRVTLIKPFMSFTSGSPLVEEVRPYLRPMSTMSDEEKSEILELLFGEDSDLFYIDDDGVIDGKPTDLMNEGLLTVK